MIANRKNDTKVEREIANFINDKLYNDTSLFKEYVRTDTLEEQISGSDVILSTSDGKLDRVVVDEKVAARYANTELNTFSLELSFINRRGVKQCGWFTDTSKKTEYYLLGWINKADIPFNKDNNRYDTDLITKDNILEFEWCLVSREKIFKFLEKKGWTLDKLSRQDDRIRKNGGTKTKAFIDDVSFRYSDTYIEKPINLLLKKNTYIKLSDYKGKILNHETSNKKKSC